MKKMITDFNGTTKYTHDDGSETTIKSCLSQQYSGGDMQIIEEDRNKYSIMISSSVGCQMGCKFCGLTGSDIKFKKIKPLDILTNVKEAIKLHPENLSDKHVKLCWMGMGECSALGNISVVTKMILRFLIKNHYALGVDSVDFGTILPDNMHPEFFDKVVNLETYLHETYNINPENNHGSACRVFFSIHDLRVYGRSKLIPASNPWNLYHSMQWLDEHGIDVIMHYTLLDGVNDDKDAVASLLRFMLNHPQYQLRLLRFNETNGYKESKETSKIWNILKPLSNVKLQVSPGEEIQASCGMFG